MGVRKERGPSDERRREARGEHGGETTVHFHRVRRGGTAAENAIDRVADQGLMGVSAIAV